MFVGWWDDLRRLRNRLILGWIQDMGGSEVKYVCFSTINSLYVLMLPWLSCI